LDDDSDKTPDLRDPDDNGDGIADYLERRDSNGDGIPDSEDEDVDGDATDNDEDPDRCTCCFYRNYVR